MLCSHALVRHIELLREKLD